MSKMKRIWLLAGIAGWLTIAVLSLVPAEARPHSGAGGFAEHFVAYLLVTACLSMGLSGSRLLAALALLAASSGFFEILQLQIPGRTAELEGFLSGVLGVGLGYAAVSLLRYARWVQ